MKIKNDEGLEVEAMTPIIVSASRATDIPTFYSDWFVERWKIGHIRWKNPFNGASVYVSFKNTRMVVFWTKNPKPMFHNLDFIDENIKNYYFQFTLNDYYKERLELKVPEVNSRIETFIKLSERIGKEKVIWRFDPLILTDKIGVNDLLRKLENIGDKLIAHTRKLVISFADISIYRKVHNNLKNENIDYSEFTPETMLQFASGLQELNKKWEFEIATCSEKIDLQSYGIEHNKCIDDDLMIKLFSPDKELMKFLGVKVDENDLFNKTQKTKNVKDKGQREDCGCIISKDIGQYNTCPHDCLYCYANTNIETAQYNYKTHIQNSKNETITGK